MTKEEQFEFFKENFGKEVQYRDEGQAYWLTGELVGYDSSVCSEMWIIRCDDQGIFDSFDEVRVKPERKKKDWAIDTCPWPLSFKLKDSFEKYTATNFLGKDGVQCGANISFSWKELSKKCEQLNGEPCHDWED